MEPTAARALPIILDLHNGTLDLALMTEPVSRLWMAEDDYSQGSLTFHLALGHFPPPQAVDFYVMALALMNHREAHRVPNLLKLCREDLGLWRAALEMEAGYRGGAIALDAIEELTTAADPFFQSLHLLQEAMYLRRTNTGDRSEIKRRLHQALTVFQNSSVFETGRTLLALSQVEASYDLALKTTEQALECFSKCKNRYYESDARLAMESIREKHRERRSTSRSRTVDLGFLIRPLIQATDLEAFFSGLIQVLTSRTFLALDHVTLLHKTAGGEHIVAGHHAGPLEKETLSNTFDLGCGYRLVVSQATDPVALEMILPLAKRELIRLARAFPITHSVYRRQFGRFTYYDSTMDEILNLLEIAGKDQPEAAVMLRGEPGVGKTDLAYALHLAGPTRSGKFVVYDAATAVDKSFMVAELFGTVKGAFTDAQPRIGKIEEAGNGTLFIDEIGELTPQCQALLLRVLQNRQYQRMGTNEYRPVTCRIILATNQPIEEWCKQSVRSDAQPLFRSDLPSRFRYWIHIKPLHEIPDQIVPTALSFLREQGEFSLSPEAEIFLRSMRWIGNYRSLQNTVGLSVNLAKSFGVSVITPEIIHRAIGHHPLLFAPVTSSVEPPQTALALAASATVTTLPPDQMMSNTGFPFAPEYRSTVGGASGAKMPPSGALPAQSLPYRSAPSAQPLVQPGGQPVAYGYLPPAANPVSPVEPARVHPSNGATAPIQTGSDEAIKQQFIRLFKEVFDEFDYNRRKYFEFSILSNISQIIHQERFPRAKTFSVIYNGLMSSPYVQDTIRRQKIEELGQLFRMINPKWPSE
ncbi:MAG TPA: sigma 54-interacting transcriptional regulator [Acidobacteriota bacterium]|nr:sigma 54-interacting transcriptional regulator [Acidobacteriota bacterium]HND18494.1 sigma 54-interacting transcriptional regulator [Acidobacteriota bacterium]